MGTEVVQNRLSEVTSYPGIPEQREICLAAFSSASLVPSPLSCHPLSHPSTLFWGQGEASSEAEWNRTGRVIRPQNGSSWSKGEWFTSFLKPSYYSWLVSIVPFLEPDLETLPSISFRLWPNTQSDAF